MSQMRGDVLVRQHDNLNARMRTERLVPIKPSLLRQFTRYCLSTCRVAINETVPTTWPRRMRTRVADVKCFMHTRCTKSTTNIDTRDDFVRAVSSSIIQYARSCSKKRTANRRRQKPHKSLKIEANQGRGNGL